MKNITVVFGIIIFLMMAAQLPAGDFSLSIMGGAGFMMEQGAEGDYLPEENDFPVIPAFTGFDIGLRLAYRFGSRLGMELGVAYIGSATVELTDPSDSDTVSVDAFRHLAFTLSIRYFLGTGKWRPYLLAGAGVDSLQGEAKAYTSTLGYRVERDGPDQDLVSLFNLGGGFLLELGKKLDLRVELGYYLMFADPENYNLITLLAGLSLTL